MSPSDSRERRKKSVKRVFRLAVVNSHPIQYFAPLYAYLNRDPHLEVTALYCSDSSLRGTADPGFGRSVVWDIDLLAGYRAVFLGKNARKRTPTGFWSLVCPEVWSEIRRGRYDAVLVHGYNYAATVLAIAAAKVKGLPVLMRSETHLGLRRDGWGRSVRDSVLAVAYRFVDGFLAIGTANRTYYRALGVPEPKLFHVPYAVDNERFMAAATLTREERATIRARYGLPTEGAVVLYASKLMRRKHPDDVIRAMAILGEKGRRACLLMVGSGEMDDELRSLADRLNMRNVFFSGFVNQTELPRIFAACDVFVLPSENEPWGLVVNEVMCAGIPVVVADEVGCVVDLVQDGVNGYRTKAGDVVSLVVAIEKLLSDDHKRQCMGIASRTIIAGWSYEQCRVGLTAALAHVVRD